MAWLPPRYSKGVSVTAVGAQEMHELLYTENDYWYRDRIEGRFALKRNLRENERVVAL